jgi:excisionase family DNA binding protein
LTAVESRRLSVREAADRLGLPPKTVYNLCSMGKLAHYRIGVSGGKIVITEADIENYWR